MLWIKSQSVSISRVYFGAGSRVLLSQVDIECRGWCFRACFAWITCFLL